MERNCQKCIHHISGLCSKWECEMTTLEDYRDKVIDEFASELANKDNIVKHDIDELMESSGHYDLACNYLRAYIDDIAEQLKGE